MKIAIILGTRPEIIKLAPIIKELEQKKKEFVIVHTNQHYDYQMDQIFFKELGIKPADFNLQVGSSSHSEMLGKMLIALDKTFVDLPEILIVQGDTNSTLAGALFASKSNIRLVHIESGSRSFDRSMPEEINRVVTDSISDLLFAATEAEELNLLNEGIGKEKIFTFGSTVFDSIKMNSQKITDQVLNTLSLSPKKFCLVTLHRAGNVDTKERLMDHIQMLTYAKDKYLNDLHFIWPLHPRTKANIDRFGISIPPFITVIEPLGYFDTLSLIKNAKIIFTDSGGIQEEAFFLRTPCVTLRDATEWVYTIQKKANFLVYKDIKDMDQALTYFLDIQDPKWESPYLENVSERIVNQIFKYD